MKTPMPYVRSLHLFFLLFLTTTTNLLFAQTQYEGFGAGAIGGGNSTTVYHVTNLNSSGAGSLANGIGSNRTIVFDVSGTIVGRFIISNVSYLTIDATGQNITIDNNNNGDGISIDGSNAHHIIIKGLHVTDAGNDGINVLEGAHDVVITNCTSWGNRDGNIDVANDAYNVTVQYCIIGGGADGWSGSMLITSRNVSVHHNLITPSTPGQVGERCPLIHSNYSSVGSPNADFRNNLVWKWGRNGGTGSGYGTAVCYNATANVINNYYFSNASPGSAVNTDDGYGSGATGKVYASGNVSGNTGVNPNAESNVAMYAIPAAAAVTTQDACTAAALVLANAGPSPRNSIDINFINAVTPLTNCSTTPTNQPPVANAGNDITITLPTTVTTLNGSGTDPDGTIASYSWSRVSAPAGSNSLLGNATSAITALTALTLPGTYVYRLTVTDDDGATDTDDITVTVNPLVNLPPTANAGTNITLTMPVNSTTLTGSGTDPDGTINTYVWTKISTLAGTIATPNSATTNLTGLAVGTHTFRLTVTDNGGATDTDDITVTVNPAPNQAPSANAGNNIVITLPTNTVTLNGSGTDPDGTITAYQWTKISTLAGTIASPTTASTQITGLVAGTHTFRLRVTDNSGATATDDVTVTVNPAPNQAPSANAGNNIVITLPTNTVTLNGSGTDPDGTIASYQWTKITTLAGTIASPTTASTQITGLVAGTHTFRLRVTDNSGATATDDVNVTVNPAPNQGPSANAGNNIVITLPTNTVTLNGSGTDPDGTITTYAWTKISTLAGTIASPANASTQITDLVAGTHTFRLTVTDNSGATATDDVNVIVNAAVPTNQPPVANAGANISITLPTNSVTLNGNATDADGTVTTYAWTKISTLAGTIATPANASTQVTGLVAGTHTFRLTVTDDDGATATDDVTVIVNPAPPTNQPPIANAGINILINLPTSSVTLDGTGSQDLDGTISTYAWAWVSGAGPYTITNPNAATTTITGFTTPGTYVFRLTVTDNGGATDMDNVVVTVGAAANQAPAANAGNNITITLPTNSVTLNGSGSDADGTIASYVWSRIAGPTTNPTFGTPNAATTTVSGLQAGTYVFRLTVTDNDGATATDDVTVVVNPAPIPNQPPVARAGNDIVMTLPTNSTTLNGNTSTDADGIIVSYSWTYVSGPAGWAFTSAGSAATGLNITQPGTYVFRLTVTDDDGASSTDNITVTVNPAANQPPVANAGNDITITLPVNSVTLTGSGTDPNGTITTYAWTRVSGPTPAPTIVSPNAASTNITGLVSGVHVFRLTVTDNNGATGVDNVTVVVNPANPPANQPPVANAGNDITITLPVNSTTLNGGGTDPDGTIVSYNWTKLSGPAGVVGFSNANAASTSVTNLVQGVYVFRLTVMDNYGATDTDDRTVTVNAAVPGANQAPIARTNADSIVLVLPTNSTTLNGTGSTDADGVISAYHWSQLSGPNQATLGNANASTTALTNLTIGVYMFELTVTDDDGATGTKAIKVIVKNTNGNGTYFNLYPNPTHGNLTLSYFANGNGKHRISIYDATRKLIKDGFVEKNQVTLTETLDVSNYRSGVYFIQIVLPDGKTVSKQFVKM